MFVAAFSKLPIELAHWNEFVSCLVDLGTRRCLSKLRTEAMSTGSA